MIVPVLVEEVATRDVETVDPETTVRVAAGRLRAEEVGSLVVLEDGEPAGILTEADVVEVFAEGTDPETPVSEVMSRPLVTVEAGTELEAAAQIAADNDVKKLPVLSDGELVGILTTTDFSYYLPKLSRRLRDEERGEWVAVDVRADTAYERDDWTFEYEAPEDNVDRQVEVGDVARFSKTHTDEDVRSFAEASGDTNRLHLDEEFAADTRFGRRIVHGTLVTGVVSAALARLPGLTIFLSKELHFLGPVGIGDRVTAVCEVAERLGEDKFRLSTSVELEDGTEVISGSATVLIDELPEE